MKDDMLVKLAGRKLDRRTFFKACGLLGVGMIAGGALQSAYKVVRLGPRRLQVERTLLRMGSFVTITAVHESRDRAEAAIGTAVEEMDRLAAILSRHDSSSPLSVLNRDGELRGAPPELTDVLGVALAMHGASDGAFDVTVQPVLDLYERAAADGSSLPDRAEVRSALARVGARRLRVAGRDVRFEQEGMRVTLDGIAPGYIVDRVSDVLAAHGVESHMVNASGDIRVRGNRADGRRWRIAVEDPRKQGNYPDVIELGAGAVSTSGSYEIYYDREKIHHHIIDPATGSSPANASVSVIASSSMQADALSTAAFVLPPARAMAVVNTAGGGECLVIGSGGAQHRSPGWKEYAASGA
jgi:thiamine biosynthesis lipoprotein